MIKKIYLSNLEDPPEDKSFTHIFNYDEAILCMTKGYINPDRTISSVDELWVGDFISHKGNSSDILKVILKQTINLKFYIPPIIVNCITAHSNIYGIIAKRIIRDINIKRYEKLQLS